MISTPSRLRSSVLVVAVLLGAVVVALGGAAFSRKVETFQPLGFGVRWAAGLWQVAQAGPGAAVAPGDRLLLVDGERPGSSESDLRTALRHQPSSELVVQRGEVLVPLHYARPPLAVDWPYLVLSLIGALYLLVGGYTLLRDRRAEALVFHFWCLASATVYLLSPNGAFDTFGRAAYLVEELARLLLPPLTLHLFLVFPSRLPLLARWRALLPFLYLPSAVLLTLQADLALANGRYLAGAPSPAGLAILDRLELYLLVAAGLVAVVILVRRLLANAGWEQNRQLMWVAVGMAAGYVPFVLLYVLPLALGRHLPTLVTTVAVAPLACVPLAFAYAILRYKLWDIGVIVRDALASSLTILLGVFGFSLVHFAVSRGVPQELAMARSVVSFAAGLVIAGLLVPTRRSLGQVLERLQYRHTFGKRQALSRFGRELLHERELGRLASSLIRHLTEALSLDRATLYLVQGERLAILRAESALPSSIAPTDFGDEIWQAEVLALEASGLPLPEPSPLERLVAAGYRYAFPLHVRGNRLGLVLTGHKDGDQPLSTDDLELVRNLLNQSALAIENAQLVGQLQRQLDQVSALQRHNQGIIESSPAGIAVLDPEGRIVETNHVFATLIGASGPVCAGQELAAILPVSLLPAAGDLLEVSFRDDAGRERFLQLSLAPMGGSNERILVVQDVAERVAMENTLKEKERLAALGMLAAGVAHEVNTPITGISSYAQMLLADTPLDDPRRGLLEKVEKQTFRAARIVSNLLEFARDKPHQQAPLALVPVMREAVALLDERIREAAVEVTWSLPVDEVAVVGNEGELQQVVSNLVLNALDAMAGCPPGTPRRLTIDLAAAGESVVMGVADTGTGIAPEALEKIFQPFFSTKLNRGGTGLGLSISYNIARRHGGTLRATSAPGQGSRFEVELPRRLARVS